MYKLHKQSQLGTQMKRSFSHEGNSFYTYRFKFSTTKENEYAFLNKGIPTIVYKLESALVLKIIHIFKCSQLYIEKKTHFIF